jgi:hypothetical protein
MEILGCNMLGNVWEMAIEELHETLTYMHIHLYKRNHRHLIPMSASKSLSQQILAGRSHFTINTLLSMSTSLTTERIGPLNLKIYLENFEHSN